MRSVSPKARELRFRRLKEIGCLACWMLGFMDVYPEIHHQNLGEHAGQKRLGDEFTVPLCGWHHQGHGPESFYETLGPSLKLHPREFREKFGNDAVQLEKTNDLIRMRNEMAFGWKTGHLTEALRSTTNFSTGD